MALSCFWRTIKVGSLERSEEGGNERLDRLATETVRLESEWGVEQERGEYKGDRERIDGDLKGALRNEQLFVGLVGVQQGCLVPTSP